MLKNEKKEGNMYFIALRAVLKCTCRSWPRAWGDQGSLFQILLSTSALEFQIN